MDKHDLNYKFYSLCMCVCCMVYYCLFMWVYSHMCVIVSAHMCKNVVEAKGRCLLLWLINLHLYFWRQGLLLNLELIDLDQAHWNRFRDPTPFMVPELMMQMHTAKPDLFMRILETSEVLCAKKEPAGRCWCKLMKYIQHQPTNMLISSSIRRAIWSILLCKTLMNSWCLVLQQNFPLLHKISKVKNICVYESHNYKVISPNFS